MPPAVGPRAPTRILRKTGNLSTASGRWNAPQSAHRARASMRWHRILKDGPFPPNHPTIGPEQYIYEVSDFKFSTVPAAVGKFLIRAFIGCSGTLLHHLIATVPWPKRGRMLAVLDILAILTEIGVVFPPTDVLHHDLPFLNHVFTLDLLVLFQASAAVQLATLGLSMIFRIATLFQNQGHGLLGGCRPVFPPYNVKSILLNRSTLRPLIRGESMFIIMFRAFLISCLAIFLPAFSIYSIILQPALAQVYLKTLSQDKAPAQFVLFEQPSTPEANGDLAFVIASGYLNVDPQHPIFVLNVSRLSGESAACSTVATPPQNYLIYVECPFGWSDAYQVQFSLNVFQDWSTTGVSIVPLPWSSRSGYARPEALGFDIDGGLRLQSARIAPIFLIPNSRRFGLISWTARQLHGSPVEYLYLPELYDLQEDTALTLPGAPNGNETFASLRIINPYNLVNRIEVEVTDSSALSGLSNVGGFWTFVNGTFALFFGANIFYFAFGRRPLSALGVAHLFQRSSLARNWHEDFPALHTEGGLPGSDSAGIVAFIRERLVDLDRQAPEGPEKDGLSTLDATQPTPKSSEIDRGSRTDAEEGSTSTLDLPVESEARLESLPAHLLRTAGYILHDSPS
ncbi:hypothetical protein C8F01DRAFT_1126822 [Mycena amicta]|nr:hypothetical protein C8F01DRAFT_1126822 [Mycena amicta]